MRRLAALSLLVCVAGGVAACGGQPGPNEGGTAPTPTVAPQGTEAPKQEVAGADGPGRDTGTTRRPGTSTSSSSSSSSSSTSSSSTSTTSTPNGPDGNPDPPVNGATISATEFKQRVGRLCVDFKAKGDALFKGSSKPTAAQFDQLIVLFEQLDADVAAVGTPKGLEHEVAELHAKWSELTALLKTAKSAVISGDDAAMKPFENRIDSLGKDIEALGKQLGMATCFASSSSSSSSSDR